MYRRVVAIRIDPKVSEKKQYVCIKLYIKLGKHGEKAFEMLKTAFGKWSYTLWLSKDSAWVSTNFSGSNIQKMHNELSGAVWSPSREGM